MTENRGYDPGRKMPDVLVLLLLFSAVLAVLTWLLPAGSFSVGPDGLVELETFRQVEDSGGVSLFSTDPVGYLNFFFEGMVSGDRNSAAVGIMAFLLIIGGVFGIVQRSGAVDAGLAALIGRTGRSPVVMLAVLFVAFSAGGAVFGMGEEAIAFAVILVPMLRKMGYPAAIGVLLTYGATQVGFATSWMNPFSVVVAQGIAELQPLSGAGFRFFVWLTFTLVAAGWTMRLAERLRTPDGNRDFEPEKSLAATVDDQEAGLSMSDRLVLAAVAATVIWVIWGVTFRHFYLPEIATQFFTLGLVVAIIVRLSSSRRVSVNDQVDAFVAGAANLLPAVLVVAMAKGLVVLLGGSEPEQASVMNTLLYGCASLVAGLPGMLSAWLMLMTQAVINLLVTSGSGQAALTMPLMAPLGDLLGVSRQTTVLAFQLGDGLTNLVAPTSAALMGTLGVARVGWVDWLKIIWPFMLVMMLMASCTMLLAAWTGF